MDQIIVDFLKNYNFKKKGNTFVLRKKEFLLSLNFQKSQWSDINYINIGIQLENLEDKLPKTYNGDIFFRVVKKDGEKTTGEFLFSKDIDLMQELIKSQVIELFSSLETKEEIKKVIISNPNRFLVKLSGKKILGMS